MPAYIVASAYRSEGQIKCLIMLVARSLPKIMLA